MGKTHKGSLNVTKEMVVGHRLNIQPITTVERDALNFPTLGDRITNSTTQEIEWYNGTAWGAEAGTAVNDCTPIEVVTGTATLPSVITPASLNHVTEFSVIGQAGFGTDAGLANTGTYQTAVGNASGISNSGEYQISIGANSGNGNAGNNQIAVGIESGTNNTGNNQNALGNLAGNENTGNFQTAIGHYAGQSNSGSSQVAVGNAGRNNSGNFQITLGAQAGTNNASSNQIAIGVNSGRDNTGPNLTALGFNSGYGNSGTHTIALGTNAGLNNTTNGAFIVSQDSLQVFALPLLADQALPAPSINGIYLYIDPSGSVMARM